MLKEYLKKNKIIENFRKNKKRNRIIISSIIGIILIVGAITLYKTFAFYTEKVEFNIIKGRVPHFVANDLTLAIQVNGESVTDIPQENKYKVEVECDHTTGEWDYEAWTIRLGRLTKKTKCSIMFTEKKEATLNGADPQLGPEMIPIVIGNNGVVTYANTATEWYNYDEKNWANAVILTSEGKTKGYTVGSTIAESDIESYFVWIPKYAYKIQTLGTSSNEENKPFEIKFGTTNTTNSDTECIAPNVSGENGSCAVGKYMTHPAFTSFGDIKGLWIGKFETGYKGSTDKTSAQKNENNPTKVQIKPNVNSWRSITTSNMFKTSYNYKRNLDSHMMKNTEWGAIAYLTHSIYGKCNGTTCEEVYINNNSNYVNGYAYSNANSVKTSSTGNYSGIYDLSGGAWESVAGVTGSLITSTSEAGFTSSDISTYNKKYYDTYSMSVERILGDATAETAGWNSDYTNFVDLIGPWLTRGGDYNDASGAGVFGFYYYSGAVGSSVGFRVVLAY